MKNQLTKYKCDECKKESKEYETGYPYEEGWVYLFDFSFKLEKEIEHEDRDKHFCSNACLLKRIKNNLKGGKNGKDNRINRRKTS